MLPSMLVSSSPPFRWQRPLLGCKSISKKTLTNLPLIVYIRFWGSLSDRIGRKPVLLLGCAGTMFSLLIVGFSSNFWMALLGRAVGGLLDGNMGVIQTMVGEITVNPKHEREYSQS